MFATVECEAAVFGCRTVRPEVAATIPCVLAMPGADHVLEALPADRWALLNGDRRLMREAFTAAALPPPPLIVEGADATAEHPAPHDYERAVHELGADPAVSLAFEDTARGIDTARRAGLQVIGVAAGGDAEVLASADFVVPSLLSVRVLGTHPFIVFEVDALPDVGTGAARRR